MGYLVFLEEEDCVDDQHHWKDGENEVDDANVDIEIGGHQAPSEQAKHSDENSQNQVISKGLFVPIARNLNFFHILNRPDFFQKLNHFGDDGCHAFRQSINKPNTEENAKN